MSDQPGIAFERKAADFQQDVGILRTARNAYAAALMAALPKN